MIDNFVAQVFDQIEFKKRNTFFYEIEFARTASTIKGCVLYSVKNEYNGEAFNSGFSVPVHECKILK